MACCTGLDVGAQRLDRRVSQALRLLLQPLRHSLLSIDVIGQALQVRTQRAPHASSGTANQAGRTMTPGEEPQPVT